MLLDLIVPDQHVTKLILGDRFGQKTQFFIAGTNIILACIMQLAKPQQAKNLNADNFTSIRRISHRHLLHTIIASVEIIMFTKHQT